jgi:hypothetical protein
VSADLDPCLKHNILQQMQHAADITYLNICLCTELLYCEVHIAPAAEQACVMASVQQRRLIEEDGLYMVYNHSWNLAAAPHLVEPAEAAAVQECLASAAAEVERQRGTHARKEYLQQQQQQAEANIHQR